MKKLLCLTGLSCLILSACSSIPTPSEKYAKYSAEQIYQTAEVKLAKREYKDATEAYEGLDSLYPFNPHAEQAQLDMIYAYYENSDMPSAAAAAERYIRLYPRSKDVDYAYYMKGVANFNQDRGFFQRYFPVDQASRDPGTMLQSYQDFKTLLTLYPNSPYAADAKQHMIYLRNTFAQRDVEVASFYLEKQAYEAAINRANDVLKKYDDTPAAKTALNILYDAYTKLGLTHAAEQVKQTLAINNK